MNEYLFINNIIYNLNESSEKMSKQNLLRLRLESKFFETPVSNGYVHKKYWSLNCIPDISK